MGKTISDAASTILETRPLDLTLYRKTANSIRILAIDAIQQARSGHPGLPLGMADAATVLWMRHLRHNPRDPQWPNRDRFILSAGHGSMLLYALLYLTGYDITLDDLKAFRQLHSKTPGHPEFGLTPGVEMTTGPLGQGIATAVGMAIAERWLAARFNRPEFPLFDHFTYVLASDGDLMEGLSHEACSLAGHLGLGKLIVLYDDNRISIDGPTELAFTEDVMVRFQAYGWHVQQIDGHDPVAVDSAILQAKAVEDQPSLIACRTTIGYGSPNRAGTAKVHGEPLGEEEVRLTKKQLGWPEDSQFYVPVEVLTFTRQALITGAVQHSEWQHRLEKYLQVYPEAGAELQSVLERRLPAGWDTHLPDFAADQPMATRAASGAVLNALAPRLPYLIGGSADLSGSNNTRPKDARPIRKDDFSGRYIHFGVREHAMGAVLNGLALHSGLRPYGGTFLVFSDYMRPAIRLAALMEQPVIYVFTHDSIGLGEDGPTHQPIEHLASLRAMPGLVVIRPADATETAEAWRVALQRQDGPTALILTRQKLPVLDRRQSGMRPAEGVASGAYILSEAGSGTPQAILLASGSEVHLALEAQKQLELDGVPTRVVSFPSFELFERQPESYRQTVLPDTVSVRVAIEAGATMGWQKYVGSGGKILGLDRFGASAPYSQLYEAFGLTAERVVKTVKQLLTPKPS